MNSSTDSIRLHVGEDSAVTEDPALPGLLDQGVHASPATHAESEGDDVGGEPATLAMKPLIAPAVIKLDVTVTQGATPSDGSR